MLTRLLANAAYIALACVALPFIGWRRIRHRKRTPALFAKLSGRLAITPGDRPRVWIHAVSVGEVLQVRPLIRELTAREPATEIVLSTTTASGMSVAREKYADCVIVPFPFDFSWAVRNAFTRIRPDAVCLVELELWPNFISEANRRGVPLVVANGRLSEKSHRGYLRFRPVVAGMFGGITHVCAQNETYADRFESLGVPRAQLSVTGSIKFDGLATDRLRPEVCQLRSSFGFSDHDRVFVAGSTHDPEESAVVDAWDVVRREQPDLQLVLVPRHPERFDAVAAMIEARGFQVVRRSQQQSVADPDALPARSREGRPGIVYLLDTLGELSACWGMADFAFVGGTLTKRGGQNMLEPAAYGCPVLLGPNTWNFTEIATGLIATGGGVTVTSAEELANELVRLAGDAAAAQAMSHAAKSFAASQCGAAAATAERILEELPQRRTPAQAA